MIQVYKLKYVNSVLNLEINIGVLVGHIHLNKFSINCFSLGQVDVCETSFLFDGDCVHI
jgi:hypothetical protein